MVNAKPLMNMQMNLTISCSLWRITAKSEQETKKKNFTETELEVLVGEVEVRKNR